MSLLTAIFALIVAVACLLVYLQRQTILELRTQQQPKPEIKPLTAGEIVAQRKQRHQAISLPRSWSDERAKLEARHATQAKKHDRLVTEIEHKQQSGEL